MQVTALTTSGQATPLWRRAASLSAGDGRVAFSATGAAVASVVQDFEHAPAIFAGPVSAPRQITHDNDDCPRREGPERQLDQRRVYGAGLAAERASADPKKKAPMITVVHGGPAAASTPYFASQRLNVALINAGYDVFMPNPRGSYGQGEAFIEANKRDFGGGDLRDILAGIDAVEKIAPVDDARLGLMGGSYGGFMAMWANTQTNRFKAMVAAAGLSNWISYYGTNGIDQWMLPFFGKTMYDDPAAYNAVSAVNFVETGAYPDVHLRRRARYRGAADPVGRVVACAEGHERAGQPGHLSR